jgi:hypothetical protein
LKRKALKNIYFVLSFPALPYLPTSGAMDKQLIQKITVEALS